MNVQGILRGVAVLLLLLLMATTADAQRVRWTEQQAWQWYNQQPWLVGANFLPSNAVNELEMWQAGSFDPVTIDRELGWAEGAGLNTVRVFLHDQLWQQDAAGFRRRIDQFLTIAARHHMRPILVLFDSCWDPYPKLGEQRPPVPGVHNSGWVQAPGRVALEDSAQYGRLKDYVVGVVGAFAQDQRVLAWDVWNEPDNTNLSSYGKLEPKNKVSLVTALLPQVFEWAREANPVQPLTSGPWQGDWSMGDKTSAVARIQLEQSDVISFHNYDWPEHFAERVRELSALKRPLICTEFMARGVGSTYDGILPVARASHVALVQWGLVNGRSQTHLPWDSWQHPYVLEDPPVWFHDLFHADGTPYRAREIELLHQYTGR